MKSDYFEKILKEHGGKDKLKIGSVSRDYWRLVFNDYFGFNRLDWWVSLFKWLMRIFFLGLIGFIMFYYVDKTYKTVGFEKTVIYLITAILLLNINNLKGAKNG